MPEFVDGMTADFSTTTPVLKIVSQITVMDSMKQFFDFGLKLGCGIPTVEMLGSEEDWRKLTSKLKVLRTLLEPIENDLYLRSEWWVVVQKVFNNLLETYQGKPDEKWWSHIVDYEEEYASGMYLCRFLKSKGKIAFVKWAFQSDSFTLSILLKKSQYVERWLYYLCSNYVQLLNMYRQLRHVFLSSIFQFLNLLVETIFKYQS